ncbi:hemolysin-III related-domain-containing protein [Umbelopsis sp. PMI_123]|nr:hemolysin-III related-domain-containing protein [Umbelopsis sp. PMI_123]
MSTSSLTTITTARPRKPQVITLKPPSPRLHTRRHSQSNAPETFEKHDQRIRSRSLSTSVLPSPDDSSFTEQFLASVNSKLREIEDADTTGILRYVDDQVHEKWDTAKAAMVGAQRLLSFHELPMEWQENQYILTGYRFYQSNRACLKSIFALHNETMNIWSHLLGFIFFAGLGIYAFNKQFPEATTNDRAITLTFFLAALKCLICSSIYHTFICHSKHAIKSFTATLDYIGISILITASVLMTEYYSYYCRPVAKFRYMLFTALVGSTGIVMPMFHFWDTKPFRPVRIGVFLLMAFSSAVPVVHITFLNGFGNTWDFLKPVWYSVAMYLFGVAIYANRFPEKMYPGRFDFAGLHSHAIWHIFVCLGIYFHYRASLHFYAQRYTFGCAMHLDS